MTRRLFRILALIGFCGVSAIPAHAQSELDVLILGDSQIPQGAGEPYLDFFSDLSRHCSANNRQKRLLKKLGQSRTAAIGVRSTSLEAWTAKSGRPKGHICDVDKKFGVNAGTYGIQGDKKRKFVQIGQGADYQFCKANESAFESAFAPGYYRPKLLVLAFLGNSAERWANKPEETAEDVRRTLSQIPRDMSCIVLTTAPVFSKETNQLRVEAQEGIAKAFHQARGHCQVVKGLTPEIRTAIEGQAKFFRRKSNGKVADPLHPSSAAIKLFLNRNTSKLCDAVFSALKR